VRHWRDGEVLAQAVLISLRDPDDKMAEHERMCFAESARLPISELAMCHILEKTPSIDELSHARALFFGGSGAYSVLDPHPWITDTISLMLEVIDRKIPAYASCFGFQGLARALGGTVIHDEQLTEMGSYELKLTDAGREDHLFSSLPNAFWAQEGHHDHVIEVPKGVTILATGDLVHAQAFRVNNAPFWASQFHPELTFERTIERFRHYSEHYLAGQDEQQDQELSQLQGGQNSPEVPELLARVVRGQF
jgi:GMP synthase (glutamine-hydrolysing)